MADLKLVFSELPSQDSPDGDDLLAIEDGATGVYYHVTRDDLMKGINLGVFTETEYDNGTISSGTFTPDCDNDGNSHKVTIGGDCTIEVPTKTLTGSKMIEAGITVIAGGSHTVSWGSNWDWGSAGAPTLSTGKTVIGFKRTAGDTKTMAWHHGGYA